MTLRASSRLYRLSSVRFLLGTDHSHIRNVCTSDNRRQTTSTKSFDGVFAGKTTCELLRAVFVLKASSIGPLVTYSEKLFTYGKRVLGKFLFRRSMQMSFYGQFAAGESVQEVKDKASDMRRNGVGSMLCIPIETGAYKTQSKNEHVFDKNAELTSECIQAAAEVEPGGFAQVKVSALCDPQLLSEMNKVLVEHESNHRETGSWDIESMARLIEASDFDEIKIENLSSDLNKAMSNAFRRMDTLAQECSSKGVRMMMDAEQSYIQASIGYFILVLQAKYNKQDIVVYNTYQCYRKDTLARVEADHQYAHARGFKIAAKLVRGAYMDEERRLATTEGYEDPICDGLDATTSSYHSVVDYMLPLLKAGDAEMMIASHNEDTVQYVKDRMAEMNIEKNQNQLTFAQLLGMCDHVSYSLGKEGYKVYKSLPYGSLDDTLLYLSRRAQENKSVAQRTSYERKLLWNELQKRVRFSR